MDHPMSEEAEMPIPVSSTYGHAHGHMIQQHHFHHHEPPPPHQPYNHIYPSLSSSVPSNGTMVEEVVIAAEQAQNHKKKHHQQQQQVVVKYSECLKNHAAATGGNATDGCGEFMPSGEEGTIEALTCSACNCHRNFHRKEVEGELASPSTCDCYHLISRGVLGSSRKQISLPHHHHHSNNNKAMLAAAPELFGYSVSTGGSGGGALVPAARSVPIMPFSSMTYIPSESDDLEDHGGGGANSMGRAPTHNHQVIVKRFRTKFTQEQKEKMFNFAEKVGWKIQKQEESVMQQLCQEIGVKRRVLKVWMHNNKQNLAKKNNSSSTV